MKPGNLFALQKRCQILRDEIQSALGDRERFFRPEVKKYGKKAFYK